MRENNRILSALTTYKNKFKLEKRKANPCCAVRVVPGLEKRIRGSPILYWSFGSRHWTKLGQWWGIVMPVFMTFTEWTAWLTSLRLKKVVVSCLEVVTLTTIYVVDLEFLKWNVV